MGAVVRMRHPIPFDAPVMTVNCERRPSSTVATQSLMMMNGELMHRALTSEQG